MRITERRLRSIIRSVIRENRHSAGPVSQTLQDLQDHQTPFASAEMMAETVCGMGCDQNTIEIVSAMLKPYVEHSNLQRGDALQMSYDNYDEMPFVLSQSAPIDVLARQIEMQL